MRLPQLLEKRNAALAELRAITTPADAANRDPESREAERYAALEVEVEQLNERIKRAQRLDAMERAAAGTPVVAGRDTMEAEIRNVRLLDAIAAQCGFDGDFGRIREISQECATRMGRKPEGIFVPQSIFNLEKRVVYAGTTGAGAIPTDHRDDLTIDALRASSILPDLGVTFLNDLNGNVSIPAVDAGGTVEWFAESGSITGADMDVNARTLTPHYAACKTEFGRSMVLQASPDVNALATRDFGRALAAALDSVALVGGSGAQPSGIFDTITPGSVATPTYAQVLALVEAVEVANAAGANMGFALHPKTVRKLRSTLVAASTDSRMIMEGPNQLLGYKAASSTGMPLTGSPVTGSILFGDWSGLIVGTWGAVDVLANPYESASYNRGGIAVRGILSCDVVLRHEESFAGALDVAL